MGLQNGYFRVVVKKKHKNFQIGGKEIMLSKCIVIKHEKTKGSVFGLAHSWVASPVKVIKQDYVIEIEGKENTVSRIFKLDGFSFSKLSGRTSLVLGAEILNSNLIGTNLPVKGCNPIHYCKVEV